MIAVALAARPDSGKFEDGTADLTTMASWLNANLEALQRASSVFETNQPEF
jgi:hypothetical protein